MARRVVLLPAKHEATRATPVEPDLLGVKGLEVVRIQQDYRDCCKVVVEGAPKHLDDLQAASSEHFAQAWPSPNERERREQLGGDA